ncbi:MAG: alcohol dehydrogenase, partial [Acidobacteria bacterium]|nr:alcohol dehydrogenase [Acidobacteriota bacterium]
RLERLRSIAGFPERLRDAGASAADLPRLAEDAATQWTGEFNPRPLDAAGALEIYRCAY